MMGPLKTLVIGLFAVGGTFALLGCILMAFSGRRYRFLAGRVNGVVGGLGEGKSAFAVGRVLIPAGKAIRSRRGLVDSSLGLPVTRVITNFDFWPHECGLDGLEVVKLVPDPDGLNFWQQLLRQCYVDDTGHLRLDAVVVIDEISFYAQSDERSMDPVGHLFMKYARKFNCEVWWLAQDHMQVHKRVRVLTQRIWMMRESEGLLPVVTWSRWFAGSAYRARDVESNVLPARPLDRRLCRLSRKVGRSYDTREAIASDLDDLRELQAAAAYADELTAADLEALVSEQEPT